MIDREMGLGPWTRGHVMAVIQVAFYLRHDILKLIFVAFAISTGFLFGAPSLPHVKFAVI